MKTRKTASGAIGSLLMGLTVTAAFLLVPIALLNAALTVRSPWQWAHIVGFCLLTLEKIWAMFFRMPKRFSTTVRRDWTTVAVGAAYTLVMYLTLFAILAPPRFPRSLPLTLAGGILLAMGIGLRHWASLRLGRQWAVHLDEKLSDRHLITDGPYRWVRHPLYLAACLEAAAIPLLFQAPLALVTAILVFIPLEVYRARFEEHFLTETFGEAYRRYRRQTPGFIPWSYRTRGGP